MLPSPTPLATRFTDPYRTSPARPALRHRAYRNRIRRTHKDRNLAREFTRNTSPKQPMLTNNVLQHLQFTFENDKEPRFLALAYQPLPRLQQNVRRTPRQSLPFLLVHTHKHWNFFEILESNHCF
jgi:hypothetical protein